MPISDLIDFKQKQVQRDRKVHFIPIKGKKNLPIGY